MKNILVRHAYEIFDLSVKSGVDVGIGMEYFTNNCFTYPRILYPGIDYDYQIVSAEWIGMDYVNHGEAKNYWSDLMKKYYHELGGAFARHDKEKFDEIVKKFLEDTKEWIQ